MFRVSETRIRRAALLACAALLALLLAALWASAPQTALAQSEDDDVKPCTSCHSDEGDAWKVSPHATSIDPETGMPVATCESCHGEYVRGHPDEALEPLRVDSSSCRECHAATYEQWQQSVHGDEGVQCISCHLPHSQDVRLTDEQQCKACHQDSLTDPLHTAHWDSEASCTDCHMASATTGAALASTDPAMAMISVPSHDFVSVSADNCLECHREDVSLVSREASPQEIAYKKAVEELPVVSANLAAAQQSNRSLAIFSLANLGFGVGIGGILGIVFMIFFVRMSRRGE
jgi:hypothetical protein